MCLQAATNKSYLLSYLTLPVNELSVLGKKNEKLLHDFHIMRKLTFSVLGV